MYAELDKGWEREPSHMGEWKVRILRSDVLYEKLATRVFQVSRDRHLSLRRYRGVLGGQLQRSGRVAFVWAMVWNRRRNPRIKYHAGVRSVDTEP